MNAADPTIPISCLLCGGHPRWLGRWLPTRDQADELGQPEGIPQPVTYAVCMPCWGLGPRRVEAKILADASRRTEAAAMSPRP